MKFNTKLHEALDLFVPLHYHSNTSFMKLKDSLKFLKMVLAMILILSVVLMLVLWIFMPFLWALAIASVVILPAWVFAVWLDVQEKRYNKQVDTIVDHVQTYTDLPFQRKDIEGFIGQVYIHQVAQSVIQENE